MSTEFKGYGFPDYLRATLLAPLASIPVAMLAALLFLLLFPPSRSVSPPREDFVRFIDTGLFLNLSSLPIAYISTALFGAVGCEIAFWTRVRLTIPIGAVAGIICGAISRN